MASGGTTQPGRVTVRDLERTTRGLCALVGIAGLLFGGVAVFKTANQAGTVALLTIGAVASLLALVGKVPLRWVIGGNEIDMSEAAVEEAIDILTAELPPDQTASLADRLTSLRGSALTPMAEGMLDYVTFENQVLERLSAVASDVPAWQYSTTGLTREYADRGVDVLVKSRRTGKNAAVMIKMVKRRESLGWVRQSIERFRASGGGGRLVVVINDDFGRRDYVASRLQADHARVVALADPHFDELLRSAIEWALSPTGAAEDGAERRPQAAAPAKPVP